MRAVYNRAAAVVASLRLASAVALALLALACQSPDPKTVLEISELETYWAVDRAAGERVYIAPVVRFSVRNKGAEELRTVQASANFRRKGEEQLEWGGAWQDLTPTGRPLPPGASRLVVLTSDGRYYSSGEPHTFFEHALFKDARAQVWLRVGNSRWALFAEPDVERRIGTRAVEGLLLAPQ